MVRATRKEKVAGHGCSRKMTNRVHTMKVG